ncbi:MAG: class I SAM-dependent methyltransferase [Candidatus Latescibacterota bacterium]
MGKGTDPVVLGHNRRAWDRQVERGNQWTVPVSDAVIEAARRGEWAVYLTPSRPVPRDWVGALEGAQVLCLASGGGQQGPVLAAAGARVAVLDNSPRQLEQDRRLADRHGLDVRTVLGDMANLSAFATASFDLIVHPVSNTFVPDVRPVWREAFRVLRPGAALLAGFDSPVLHLFDDAEYDRGVLVVRHVLPRADAAGLSAEEKRRWLQQGKALEYGHTLDDQIGGQLDAGFLLTGFYEDRYPADQGDALSRYMATFMATRAVKPARALARR